LSSLTHVPEECQDAVNEHPGRFNGLMEKHKRANKSLQVSFSNF
jgi:hypothetical protein